MRLLSGRATKPHSLHAALIGMAAGSLALSACGSEDGGGDPVAGYDENASQAVSVNAPLDSEPEIVSTISEIVSGNPDLSTFAGLLKSSGLGTTLAEKGEFTILAPNNIAFDKLGTETLATLTEPENADQLARILRYHVVEGKLMTSDLRQKVADAGGSLPLKTLAGPMVAATVELDQIKFTDAAGKAAGLTVSDVEASNGVVQIVDEVMIPAN